MGGWISGCDWRQAGDEGGIGVRVGEASGARPCPKPHPRCALACQGGLFLARRDKKAREFVEE